VIQVRADDEVVGYLKVGGDGSAAPSDSFIELSVELEKPLNGVRDLTFVFYVNGRDMEFNWWKFE
jgi:hypothetical protein